MSMNEERMEWCTQVVCPMCAGRMANDSEISSLCYNHRQEYEEYLTNKKNNVVFKTG
jgi:hypothetical protein